MFKEFVKEDYELIEDGISYITTPDRCEMDLIAVLVVVNVLVMAIIGGIFQVSGF